MKILLIAAMPTESEDIINHFSMKYIGKLANFFPYYSVNKSSKEIFLLQTHVGSINASAASALALIEIKPDVVIKVGCIGGNSPGFKKNDIVIPLSFFHSGAWITKSYKDDKPTSDASSWQSLYGDKSYQVTNENLGGLDSVFTPNDTLTNAYKHVLTLSNTPFTEAHLGSADMVLYDIAFMKHIRQNLLNEKDESIKWCTDMESYSIAQVCQIFNIPFTGIYFIASSDYEDIGGYDSHTIRLQTKQTILPIVDRLIKDYLDF